MNRQHLTLQSRVLACRGKFSGTAILCEDRAVDYREFDAATDHVAALLAGRGIGPGSVVAVRMERSEKLILALFAIFKTGAALMPLDMDLPNQRFQDIHAMLSISVTISDEMMDELLKAAPGGATPATAGPDDLAIILYTSGSSGKPKLVCHDQYSQALSSDIFPGDAVRRGIACREIDTVVAKTSVNYCSAYIFELMTALLAGKTLALLTKSEKNDYRAVGRAIERYPHCSVFLTPSELNSFLEEADFRRQLQSLALLAVAGEVLQPTVRERILRQAAPETTLLMLYGSTECFGIAWSDLRDWENVNGVICTDVRARVVGEGGEPLPAGQAGEILVASPKLMRRYIGAASEEVSIDGIRYFHTGDFGVLTADGRLLIHGRRDRMVKYHGLRIELGDVEENLNQYPMIRRAAVVVADTERGTQLLCAYYESNGDVDRAKLQDFLSERLPMYMIPPIKVRLPALPMSSHGKIDYQALKQRTVSGANPGNEGDWGGEAVDGAVEAILPALSAVFGEPVKPEENLFARGLDSLTAMKLVSRLAGAGWTASAGDILAHPTARALAACLKRFTVKEAPEQEEDGLFAITDAQYYWGANQDAFKRTHGLYVVESFLAEAVYTREALEERARALLRRHPALRSQAVLEKNRPGQRIASDAQAITEWADLRSLSEPGVDGFMVNQAQQSRIQALSNALLFKAMGSQVHITLGILCVRISDTACFFSLLTSHATSDGSSMNILKREICAQSLPAGKDAYVNYLRYISARESFQAAAGYWKQRLQGAALSILPEPRGGARQGPPDYRSLTLRLSAEQTEALTRRCSAEGVSPVAWVLYAYGQALLRQYRVQRLVMQIMLSGRGLPVQGIEDVVGCLLMNVPVLISAEDSAAQFQQRYLEAERHGFLPGPLLWLFALGQPAPASLAPFLISEVFPPPETECRFENRTRLDYEQMYVSNFIVKDIEGLKVFLHYDANRTDGEFFNALFESIKRIILKGELFSQVDSDLSGCWWNRQG